MSSGSLRKAMPHLFGDKLRELRRERGITQAGLALALGLATHSHISYLERKKSEPSLHLVVRIALFFGVSVDYLLRDTVPIEHPTPYSAHPHLMDILPQQFGAKLRQLRKQHDLSQVDLAHRLGELSQGAVSAFERGDKVPSIAIVLQCADVFGVTTDQLLRDTP